MDNPSISDAIAPYLPFLRRFSRALTGSQTKGDQFVVATLEAVIADPSVIDMALPPRVALYRAYYRIWSSGSADQMAPPEELSGEGAEATARRRLEELPAQSRHALLLTAMEEFTPDAAAQVMEISREDFDALAQSAVAELRRQTRSRVLIIEDEPIIAMDIQEIVEGLGHAVVAVADTRDTAVAAALEKEPDLVLADIQLADGSSGIDAVRDILQSFDLPVIFITAYPDRLLTGERPEPTFLITKPFRTDAVEAAISQALFFKK